jgi:hypothetical protein
MYQAVPHSLVKETSVEVVGATIVKRIAQGVVSQAPTYIRA